MYVHVSRAGVAVLDVEDLTRLHVQVDDDVDAGAALRDDGLGDVDGDVAWLVVERLRAAGPHDPQWAARFAGMITYAATQNWLDDDAARVRAHLA